LYLVGSAHRPDPDRILGIVESHNIADNALTRGNNARQDFRSKRSTCLRQGNSRLTSVNDAESREAKLPGFAVDSLDGVRHDSDTVV
jgi:hypothetical protein